LDVSARNEEQPAWQAAPVRDDAPSVG